MTHPKIHRNLPLCSYLRGAAVSPVAGWWVLALEPLSGLLGLLTVGADDVMSQRSGRVVGRTAGKGICASTAGSFDRLSSVAGDFGCGNNWGNWQCQLHCFIWRSIQQHLARKSQLSVAYAMLLMTYWYLIAFIDLFIHKNLYFALHVYLMFSLFY